MAKADGAVALAALAAGADPAQSASPGGSSSAQVVAPPDELATDALDLESDGTPAGAAGAAGTDTPSDEPDGAADTETKPGESTKPKRPSKTERTRRYEVEQQKRYQRSAKRFHEQAERMMAEADRKLEEANQKLSEHNQFLTELEEDHVTALAKRWGVPPEHVTARQADIQGLDPRVQQMFRRQEEQLAELRRERDEERKRHDTQRQQQQEFEDISRDAQWLAVEARTDYRTDYPSFFKLPEEERQDRARRLVVAKVMAHRNGRDVDYSPDVLLEELDRAARPLAERLRDEDESAQGAVQEGHGTRATAKSQGRPTARAHAEPAGRMQQSEDDLRRAALRAAREARKAARS